MFGIRGMSLARGAVAGKAQHSRTARLGRNGPELAGITSRGLRSGHGFPCKDACHALVVYCDLSVNHDVRDSLRMRRRVLEA